MKRMKLIRWFLTLCIVVLTSSLIIQTMELTKQYTTVSARLNYGITRESLSELLEKETDSNACKINHITAYSKRAAIVKTKDIGRSVFLQSYSIYGKVEEVLPTSLIAGNLLIDDDMYGCVLTKESAFELFGSIDVIGLEVEIEEKKYRIRGIIESNVEAILYEGTLDDDSFDCIEFTINDENGEFYTTQFLQIYGLSAKYVIGTNYLAKTMKNLCLVPFMFVILYSVIWFIIKIKESGQKKNRIYVVLGVGAGLTILVCKLIGYFPERWIPSKWSNFDHYSGIFQDIKQQFHLLNFAEPFAKEVGFKSEFVKTICLFVATMVGQIYLLRNLHEWGNRMLVKYQEFVKIQQEKREKKRLQKLAELEEIEENDN